jgi:hypothetical protein
MEREPRTSTLDGDMNADADPMAEYLTYLADVRGGAVADMGLYIAWLPENIRGVR